MDGALAGPVTEIATALYSNLLKDYEQNHSERNSVPWGFDYVVMREPSLHSGEIAILTRLFNSKEPGNIFYGRYVARDGEDSFLLWFE